MNAFTQARRALVEDLSAIDGATAYEQPPALFDPPALLVVPAQSGSLIGAGDSLGDGYVLALDVYVIVAHAGSEAADLAALEDLLAAVLVNTADWGFRGADVPFLGRYDGSEYPTSVVHVTKHIEIE